MCELGELSSDQGWEEELILDEGHVIQASNNAVKEKRRLERDVRRQAQDALRVHKKMNSNPTLGIKMT